MRSPSTKPELLSNGINSGGMSPRNHLIHDALGDFQMLVVRERARFTNEGLRVNIVFDVPGPMFQPDYEGVLATRLDRKNDHLLVLAAVPPDLASEQVSRYVTGVLRSAVDAAREYLLKRKVPLKLENLEALVHHLVGELGAAGT
jgi:hypothetical protein